MPDVNRKALNNVIWSLELFNTTVVSLQDDRRLMNADDDENNVFFLKK